MKKVLAQFAVFMTLTGGLLSCPTPAPAVVSSTTTQTLSAYGNGVTTHYTIGFTFQDNSQLVVTLVDYSATPPSNTTVVFGAGAGKYTLAAGNPSATVIMGTAPTSTQKVLIQRVTPITQTVSYVETDAFPASDHESAMDKNILIDQELNSKLNLKIGLATTSTAAVPIFPDPVANHMIMWDSSALQLTYAPTAATSPTSGDVLYFNGTAWVDYALDAEVTTLNSAINSRALASDLSATNVTLTNHINNTSNPHNVTAAQVGNGVAQWNANKIQGSAISSTTPANGQALVYSSGQAQYVPTAANVPPLADTHILIGQASGFAQDTAVTGDLSITDTGVATVPTVGTSTASNIHSAELAANSATAANTISTIMKRDGSGQVAATTFTGALAGNASTVTTNANLTGVITSVGNATSIASQTGTGSKFVVDTSPSLITPAIGAATGTSLSVTGQLASTVATGTAPLVVSSTTQVANLNAATAGAATTATTATNANNGATVSTSSNASFFPLFAASSTNGNQPFNLGTGLTFNPSTNSLATTTFVGALTGAASSNILKSIGSAKGSVVGFSAASTPCELVAGGDGTVLSFDSASTCGIKAISPGTGTVTSVALTAPAFLTVTGSPVTTSGTLAITATSETANFFLAAPNGSSGAMTPRAMVGEDIPTAVAAGYGNTAGGSITGGTAIQFNTQSFDQGAGSPHVTTGVGWKYTADVAGIYTACCYLSQTGTVRAAVQIFVGGTLRKNVGAWMDGTASQDAFGGCGDISLSVNDTVDCRSDSGFTMPASAGSYNYMSVRLNR